MPLGPVENTGFHTERGLTPPLFWAGLLDHSVHVDRSQKSCQNTQLQYSRVTYLSYGLCLFFTLFGIQNHFMFEQSYGFLELMKFPHLPCYGVRRFLILPFQHLKADFPVLSVGLVSFALLLELRPKVVEKSLSVSPQGVCVFKILWKCSYWRGGEGNG